MVIDASTDLAGPDNYQKTGDLLTNAGIFIGDLDTLDSYGFRVFFADTPSTNKPPGQVDGYVTTTALSASDAIQVWHSRQNDTVWKRRQITSAWQPWVELGAASVFGPVPMFEYTTTSSVATIDYAADLQPIGASYIMIKADQNITDIDIPNWADSTAGQFSSLLVRIVNTSGGQISLAVNPDSEFDISGTVPAALDPGASTRISLENWPVA